MGEFKYLVNPTNKPHSFQHNGLEYVVPPSSRRLLLKEVAEHGEKRSYALTDPEFLEDGTPKTAGNAIVKSCHLEDADVVNPVTVSEPVVIQASKDDPQDLLKEDALLKPLKPVKHFLQSIPKEARHVAANSADDSL